MENKLQNAWNRKARVFIRSLQLRGFVNSEATWLFQDSRLPLTNNLSYYFKEMY